MRKAPSGMDRAEAISAELLELVNGLLKSRVMQRRAQGNVRGRGTEQPVAESRFPVHP